MWNRKNTIFNRSLHRIWANWPRVITFRCGKEYKIQLFTHKICPINDMMVVVPAFQYKSLLCLSKQRGSYWASLRIKHCLKIVWELNGSWLLHRSVVIYEDRLRRDVMSPIKCFRPPMNGESKQNETVVTPYLYLYLCLFIPTLLQLDFIKF